MTTPCCFCWIPSRVAGRSCLCDVKRNQRMDPSLTCRGRASCFERDALRRARRICQKCNINLVWQPCVVCSIADERMIQMQKGATIMVGSIGGACICMCCFGRRERSGNTARVWVTCLAIGTATCYCDKSPTLTLFELPILSLIFMNDQELHTHLQITLMQCDCWLSLCQWNTHPVLIESALESALESGDFTILSTPFADIRSSVP